MVDFCDVSFNSIDSKMDVIEMINRVDGNSKVGYMRVVVDNDYDWNSRIVKLIGSRYTNVYGIEVYDSNE